MKLTADFHTHTPYSHGKNTVLENAERAKELGLAAVAITDHGFSHSFFGIKRREVPAFLQEVRAAREAVGIPVLAGIESNIRGFSGLCDLTESDYENFDVYLAGIHIVIRYEHFSDRKLGWKNWRIKRSGRAPDPALVKETTRAYINAVEKNPIDILTHLNFQCTADPVEVAKCCRDYGTYLEISAKKEHLTDEELAAVAATGVRFVVNSDAHSADRIGDASLAEKQILRVGIPLEQIDNIDGRMPRLRFAEYKAHM